MCDGDPVPETQASSSSSSLSTKCLFCDKRFKESNSNELNSPRTIPLNSKLKSQPGQPDKPSKKDSLNHQFKMERTKNLFVTPVTAFGILSLFLLILEHVYKIELWRLVISVFLISLLLLWSLSRTVKKEYVLVMTAVGVQVEQVNALGWTKFVQFVPHDNIKSIVINESIRRQRVITYLALLLHSPDSCGRIIVPLFRDTLPRLAVLEKLYCEIFQSLKRR